MGWGKPIIFKNFQNLVDTWFPKRHFVWHADYFPQGNTIFCSPFDFQNAIHNKASKSFYTKLWKKAKFWWTLDFREGSTLLGNAKFCRFSRKSQKFWQHFDFQNAIGLWGEHGKTVIFTKNPKSCSPFDFQKDIGLWKRHAIAIVSHKIAKSCGFLISPKAMVITSHKQE